MRYGGAEPIYLVMLGESYHLADRLEEALEAAERGLRLARERGQSIDEVWALRVLGDIASQRDPPEVEMAEDYYRRALALGAELGVRPQIAHCHRGLAELYRRTGSHDQAREHLATATTMYREMGMHLWLEPKSGENAPT
jgi:tetratricopeptide (TPR) repeat protein